MDRAQARIRPYRPADIDALYQICLLTGDRGQDATSHYHDPKLLGHCFAAPYGLFEPSLAFVAEDISGVAGYIVGALDSQAFEQRLESNWWPQLRGRYPSHLHIDLLPRLQARGYGGQLIQTLTTALRDKGSSGVHLHVTPGNEQAASFYRHIGFTRLPATDTHLFVMDLRNTV